MPLNIIIKGFERDFGVKIIERALRDIPIGYAASILNSEEDMPSIGAKEHVWYDANVLRMEDMETEYDVDWNTIPPVDEKLIYEMRECEAVVLDMMCRFERNKKISYEERKRAYLQHLRYWNHIIESKNVNVFLLSHIPHQCFDNVIYALCKKKNIPTLTSYPGLTKDSLVFQEDWEESCVEVKHRYEELKKERGDCSVDSIALSDACQKFYEKHTDTSNDPTAWYMDLFPGHPLQRSIAEWIRISIRYLWEKPRRFFYSLLDSEFWRRKRNEQAVFNEYEKNITTPDFSKKYIYVALHFQPECSSAPLAGAYVDQYLIVQMLSFFVPDDVHIYVKEHPHQGVFCRSVKYYNDMIQCRNVHFISRNFSTFALTHHAQAVVTATGTVGFEALLREKPVLLFGHRFIQYAPGVFPIHSSEDCKKALHAILHDGRKPSLRDVKLFLKAYDDIYVRAYIGQLFAPVTDLSQKENAENYGGALEPLLKNILVKISTVE